MDIPTTLKHKPVIVAEDYEHIDGRSAYHSDAKGLSLGLAQWNDRGRVDISAKVWRHTGGFPQRLTLPPGQTRPPPRRLRRAGRFLAFVTRYIST